eukprot:TRINITY_DN21068_c0_g1_i2.p1 TRINITY_DN21068_c0_g1~~TRINITY_DN21068_c0_g1_i2.p1  ORF type:complete len:341 (+),score=42.25 TRINITY_DN21068_c0_g1_i2:668-1690(+)
MDLILSQFNLDSPLPTFFELRAQEELMPILGGAFKYGLTVTAQRVIQLAPSVKYSDEMFAVLWAWLDWKFLEAIDSTFSEYFYGIRRVVAPIDANIPRDIEEGQLQTYLKLTKRDRAVSVLLSVLLPYIKNKLTNIMWRMREDPEDPMFTGTERRRKAAAVFKKVYPVVFFVLEMVTCMYWLRYLFQSHWWSAGLHSRRILLRRLEMADFKQMQKDGTGTFVQKASNFILWVIVGFRVLEWWNSTDASRSDSSPTPDSPHPASTRIPPPAPPKELSSLPSDPSICPLCTHSITNPTLNAASGIVYCYPCVHQHVESKKEDPITHQASTLDHLRRIYETSA